jgi:hypothetical protein
MLQLCPTTAAAATLTISAPRQKTAVAHHQHQRRRPVERERKRQPGIRPRHGPQAAVSSGAPRQGDVADANVLPMSGAQRTERTLMS